MTDYNALAQRIVAQGVVAINWDRYFVGDEYICDTDKPYSAKKLCQDGRVVLALMEKMSSVHVYWDDIGWSCKATEWWVDGKDTGVGNVDAVPGRTGPLAIAIVEACLGALEIAACEDKDDE